MATAGSDTVNGTSPKPSILIVGGLAITFASHYRVVDKVLPQLAQLAPEHIECCSPPYFVQADAANPNSLSRIFTAPPNAPEAFEWDYVINLGGETAWSQAPEVYAARTTQLSITLGKEAARRKCKAFVEASTGIVYSPDRKPSTESSALKPWLKLAKAKLDAEAALSRTPNLDLVILRLAHVYGEYDTGFASKFLCLARVYQEQDRELKWLWTDELRVNGVWVGDVVRAILAAANWRSSNDSLEPDSGATRERGSRRPTLLSRVSSKSTSTPAEDEQPLPGTPIFNIVDHGNTSQGTLATLTHQVFGIKTGFQGSLISQFARLNLESVVDDLNDEILQPWAEMLEKKGLRSGRLSPFLEKELLGDKDLSMDGALFERTTGFEYVRHGMGRVDIEEMIESYKRMGWWP